MRGLLHFFLRLPVLAFRMAGIVRITNRAKRGFKRTLLDGGLPAEVVDELIRDFDPASPLRETLFRSSRR
ncbi:hypothetical protein E3E38_01005 [Thermococcus sp. 18S1]|uniref:hypothetical protein n=1 Tax=Thermococcus sp. 18S1 TaxID=1638210 RepID=UPI00143877AD|nr:hypothetical protein [Thermococcus sp. 18S1]NJE29634.1 hypothetical protein [Thermococcus sp. 18S1]